MECLPQDWANTFCLNPRTYNNLMAVGGGFDTPGSSFRAILPKGHYFGGQVPNVFQPPKFHHLKAVTNCGPAMWIPQDKSIIGRNIPLQGQQYHPVQQQQQQQQQPQLIPVCWGGQNLVIPAPWQPAPNQHVLQPFITNPVQAPECVRFTKPWHRPGVYQRESTKDSENESENKENSMMDKIVVEKSDVSVVEPDSSKIRKLNTETQESCEQNLFCGKDDDKNVQINDSSDNSKRITEPTGECRGPAVNVMKKEALCIQNHTSCETSDICGKYGENVERNAEVLDTCTKDANTFAASLGLVSVEVVHKSTVWLNITLQVDTSGEIKRGQQGVQYRSLITNILTELYYPPQLCPPDDLVPELLKGEASYDDRGRLTVLQVKFITPGIYRVDSRKKIPLGKPGSKPVTLARLDSLETLSPKSQYLILGDLCPVPKKFQKCHRNAQTLYKKLMEYLYSREFRKYTLPLLLENGEEDVWSEALKAPRTRSRAAESSDPNGYVIVKRKPSSSIPPEPEGLDATELPPRRKRTRRSVEALSIPCDSVSSMRSPSPSPSLLSQTSESSTSDCPSQTSLPSRQNSADVADICTRPTSGLANNGLGNAACDDSPVTSASSNCPSSVSSSPSSSPSQVSGASSPIYPTQSTPLYKPSGPVSPVLPPSADICSRVSPSSATTQPDHIAPSLSPNFTQRNLSTTLNSVPLFQSSGNSSPSDLVPLFQTSDNSSASSSTPLYQNSGCSSPAYLSSPYTDSFLEPLDLPELSLGDELSFDFPLDLTREQKAVPLDLSMRTSRYQSR